MTTYPPVTCEFSLTRRLARARVRRSSCRGRVNLSSRLGRSANAWIFALLGPKPPENREISAQCAVAWTGHPQSTARFGDLRAPPQSGQTSDCGNCGPR